MVAINIEEAKGRSRRSRKKSNTEFPLHSRHIDIRVHAVDTLQGEVTCSRIISDTFSDKFIFRPSVAYSVRFPKDA
jgi:hypothetical protein